MSDYPGAYLKLPEVARWLNVSEKTARRMIKSGTLPAVFIGNSYRVSVLDLEAFLEGATVTSPGENDVLAEERRDAESKGPDPAVWGPEHERPTPPLPEPHGEHIHVQIADDLRIAPARVTITRETLLDVLRRVRAAEITPEQAVDEIKEWQKTA